MTTAQDRSSVATLEVAIGSLRLSLVFTLTFIVV